MVTQKLDQFEVAMLTSWLQDDAAETLSNWSVCVKIITFYNSYFPISKFNNIIYNIICVVARQMTDISGL